jgi:AcrR family transcriptional regulator
MSKKDQIAEAAFALFAEHGFADVRMDRVAARAGVAKGTLYLHFADKEDLFRAVITRKMAPAIHAIEGMADSTCPGGEEALRRFYAGLAGFVDSGVPGTLLRMILAESSRVPELAEIHYHSVVEPAAERLGEIVQKGAETENLRAELVEDYPQLLLAPALMAAIWQTQFGHLKSLDTGRLLDSFADLVVEGLKPREGRE